MPSRVPMLDSTTGTIPERFLPSGFNGTPVGTVVEYAGTGTPLDYMLCDGSAVSRTAYPELFAALGTTYGAGDGSTTFNIPNQPMGEMITAAAQSAQAGTAGADLIYNGFTLTVPPGTWELQGGINSQSNVADAQTASVWNVTTGALVPGSRGGISVPTAPPDAVENRTRTVVVTFTVTTQLKMHLTRNGSSTPSVIAGGAGGFANAQSAWLDAKRMPYNAAKSVIRYRSSSTGAMEPAKRMVGEISEYAGTVIPTSYLLCDGSLLIRTTYPDLFAAIGTTYNIGGESATQFRLPNRQGRVAVGQDSTQTEFDTLGETGGAKTHTLTVPEMPAHTHTTAGSWVNTGPYPVSNASSVHTFQIDNNTGSAGGGQAHNNLQPYIVLNYIIKAVGEIAAAVQPDMVPYRLIGEMFAWGGSGTPTGTVECDGSAISRTAYADLFSVIGTTHGAGDGSTTFNVPDMRGRVPVGQDASQTEFDTLGEKGGTKAETLTARQSGVQEHRHQMRTGPAAGVGGYDDLVTRASSGGTVYPEFRTGGVAAVAGTQGTQGFNSTMGPLPALDAHNNLQPYAVMRWLIKAVWTAAEVPVNSIHTHRVMNLDGIRRGTEIPTGGQDGDLYLKYTP